MLQRGFYSSKFSNVNPIIRRRVSSEQITEPFWQHCGSDDDRVEQPRFLLEDIMATANLSRMNVEALMELRKRVDERLLEHRAGIQKQLERMGATIASPGGTSVARGRRRKSALKGRKVPPKYRGPGGETWAGRGARPRWLVAAIRSGRKLNDFLIDKSGQKGRKKRRSKR